MYTYSGLTLRITCSCADKNDFIRQGAFNNYIRYDYPTMGLPCKEAFGWPSWDLCKGPLMTHYTMDKDAVHGGIESSLAHGVMEVVHKDMLAHKQDLFKFEDHILDALSE